MKKCDMCGSTDMYEAFYMDKNHKKLPILRCNNCGNCNRPKI